MIWEENMYELKDCGANPMGLYCVLESDTLRSVCEKCGVPASALISCNCLRDFPPAGALLVLPRESGLVYVVRVGDTLESVCRAHGMTREEFVRMNGCAYVYPTQCVYVRGS